MNLTQFSLDWAYSSSPYTLKPLFRDSLFSACLSAIIDMQIIWVKVCSSWDIPPCCIANLFTASLFLVGYLLGLSSGMKNSVAVSSRFFLAFFTCSSVDFASGLWLTLSRLLTLEAGLLEEKLLGVVTSSFSISSSIASSSIASSSAASSWIVSSSEFCTWI